MSQALIEDAVVDAFSLSRVAFASSVVTLLKTKGLKGVAERETTICLVLSSQLDRWVRSQMDETLTELVTRVVEDQLATRVGKL